MTTGLSVSRLVNVQLVLSPVAAQFENFDSALIIGDSNVINVKDRIRIYNTFQEVAGDFASNTPEYAAANLYFSQSPQPSLLYIGRWAQSATAGLLLGGPLTAAQQAMSNWTTITAGEFKIAVDGGGPTNVTCGTFASQTNLNGVASVIQTAVRALGGSYAAVSVLWTGLQFEFVSGTTGPSSAVAALTAGTANDISAQLLCTTATLSEIVGGIAAESALAAVQALDNVGTFWYVLSFASVNIIDSDRLAIAAYIEAVGGGNVHIFGITTNEAAALLSTDTTSIGYQLKQLGYRRTFYQWSNTSYAVASLIGRGTTVNFSGNNTVITFMWKQEPGVVPEQITPSQASALDSNNYNYFADFNNNTAIVVNGTVASGDFIDNTWDLDWLVNQIQTNVYNMLYTSTTKVPQTDAGNHTLKTAIAAGCSAAVNNGTLAPGQWNAAGFGQLNQGDNLPAGFYIYQPPVASQAQSDREARKSVLFQVAAKLAGAIHTVDVQLNINR